MSSSYTGGLAMAARYIALQAEEPSAPMKTQFEPNLPNVDSVLGVVFQCTECPVPRKLDSPRTPESTRAARI
jgi:hypothetical protein